MWLILAHQHDAAARDLAARWRGRATLLTPADLHRERWLLHLDERGAPTACLASRPDVTAVLSRLGGVGPGDLAHVHAQDVDYAAAELDAFLRAWLTAWAGPVVNRPSTTCLNGPGWRPEQWMAAAAGAGIRVRPVRRCASVVEPTSLARQAFPDPARPADDGVRVTVVNDRWHGPVGDAMGRRLCSLARTAGCVLLEARLDGTHPEAAVVQLSAWPDLSAPDVADAVALVLDGAT